MPGPYYAREVIKILTDHGFRRAPSSGGSHEKLVYTHPDTGEKRVVTVPLHDELAPGTLAASRNRRARTTSGPFRDWLDDSL